MEKLLRSLMLFEIPVADYHSIGRYVHELPGEVEVLRPEGFKEFLRKKEHKITGGCYRLFIFKIKYLNLQSSCINYKDY